MLPLTRELSMFCPEAMRLQNGGFFSPSELKGSFPILPSWPSDFCSTYHS